MGMQQAVSTCFSKYVTFQGRAARSEYWWFTLFVLIVVTVLTIVAVVTELSILGILIAIFELAILLPSLSVTVRRLHDSDKSGWWFFIALVPVIGGLWFLYLLVVGGTPGPNRFGNPAQQA